MASDTAVGVDLVEVDRFAHAVRRWPGLLERIFTDGELDQCLASRNADERLAARFAAKEAVFKALGVGWPDLAYRDVEVVTLDGGAPAVLLTGDAAGRMGTRAVALSIAHTGGMAMASVVATPTEEG